MNESVLVTFDLKNKTMKNLFKYLAILVFAVVGMTSCNPDSPDTLQPSYVGTYIGNCNVYLDGVFHSTTSKTISITSSSTVGHFLMANNIFMSTTCEINGNSLTIPQATTASTTAFSTEEYGTGTFSNGNLTIEFHQDGTDVNTGAVITTGKWTGTLIKQ